MELIEPFAVEAVLVMFGLGLLVIGAWRMSAPARSKIPGGSMPSLSEAAAAA